MSAAAQRAEHKRINVRFETKRLLDEGFDGR